MMKKLLLSVFIALVVLLGINKNFAFGLHWAAGLAASYTIGNAEPYGDHTGSSLAFFTQFDKKFFERLSASFGFRWEGNRMDEKGDDSRPVIRAGLNYQAARYTFLRASFGQGYRYPSMAERYTATDLGGLNIFPNPDLDPETGWSVEAGLRQGFRIKEWQGFIDLAGFQTRYHDMMEFTFGIYKPDSVEIPTLDHLGFMSVKVQS